MKKYDYKIYSWYGLNFEEIKKGNDYAKNIFYDFFKILKQENARINYKTEVLDIPNKCEIKRYEAYSKETHTEYILEIITKKLMGV